MVGAWDFAVARNPRGNVALSPTIQVEQLQWRQVELAAGILTNHVTVFVGLVVHCSQFDKRRLFSFGY